MAPDIRRAWVLLWLVTNCWCEMMTFWFDARPARHYDILHILHLDIFWGSFTVPPEWQDLPGHGRRWRNHIWKVPCPGAIWRAVVESIRIGSWKCLEGAHKGMTAESMVSSWEWLCGYAAPLPDSTKFFFMLTSHHIVSKNLINQFFLLWHRCQIHCGLFAARRLLLNI